MTILIKNGLIVNEGQSRTGHLIIKDEYIHQISFSKEIPAGHFDKIIDAKNKLVIPGIIDTHVHFREPGLTHKADFFSESKAAVAGGVTSVFDMPNVIPQTTSKQNLLDKIALIGQKSLVNFAFYPGATNTNLEELQSIDKKLIPGIKVFIASSTGNMLIDDFQVLESIFSSFDIPIVIHSEDEALIQQNFARAKQQYGDAIPFSAHTDIRSKEACISATKHMIDLATKHHTPLHFLHITTAEEIELLKHTDQHITAETCVGYLQFSTDDYPRLGSKMKVNPAIKTPHDREALIRAISDNIIRTVSTDHAPHTIAEKDNPYLQAPSGMPNVQHSFNILFELYRQGYFSLETIVDKLSHAPAQLFSIEKRGFLREGFFADIAIINPNANWTVGPENILSKCGWSALEGMPFHSQCTHTFVNGHLVFDNGQFDTSQLGLPITFER